MRRLLTGWLVQRGARFALKTASEVAPKVIPKVMPRVGQERYRQVFTVTAPLTVFIHASNARVTVRRQADLQVILEADLRASFGWNLTAQQDEAGVYIVAKRKPVVGALSYAAFTLIVPPSARLIADLDRGALILDGLEGKLEIPPLTTRQNE